MIWGLAAPNLFAAVLMLVDEIHFHRRRGLPRWERIGHPLDTLTLLACYAVALIFPPEGKYLALFAALGVFSCLFITKDEGIHTENCDAKENHLHALLFVLHPVLLFSVGLLWWLPDLAGARTLLVTQAALTLLFGLYQLIYWNFVWRP